MNQLLRLPLLKYTQTEEKNTYDKEIIIIIIIIIIKTVPSSLPKTKKGLLQIPTRRLPSQQSRNRSRQLLSQRPPPHRS